MGVSYQSSQECDDTVSSLSSQVEYSQGLCVNITRESLDSLKSFCGTIHDSEVDEMYSQPMVWIGTYIAIASWFCVLAMLADLLSGFKRKKTWFPCKFFSLNATSVTIITVAMKLPMDLSSGMPGYVDQVAKLGSMAFMCTMMTNLMPSLASMDNKALAANVIGLVILVITMIVNVCIEISTGVINHNGMANVYITLTIFLLMILISSAITVPTTKKIIKMKYEATSQKALSDHHHHHHSHDTIVLSTVERLRRHVRRYWVIAETGSPQFVMASSPLSFASGVICAVGVLVYVCFGLPMLLTKHGESAHGSQYKSTTSSILVAQSSGVMVGAVAPIFRCYIVLKWKILMRLKVEEYWTQKLYEWKESDISFISSSSRFRALVHNLKRRIISLWIIFQKVIVVSCKMMVIMVMYCSYCCRCVMCCSTSIASDNTSEEDVNDYVVQLEDGIQPTQETLIGISRSLNHLMKKAEKKQSKSLLKLVEKSTSFEGVMNFDNDQVQLLFSPRLVNTWSLPVVSLTCVAITLPKINKRKARSLFSRVGEGLLYMRMVEECLHSANDQYVDIQKASVSIWHEVQHNNKWLENTLERRAFKRKTTVEILTWFVDKAQEIVTEITNKGFNVNNPPKKLIAANSMYRVAQTIMLNYPRSIGSISEKELFNMICGMIADILAACLTNIPVVIMKKCNESASEASVEAAAKILGSTREIITKLEARQLPSMDPSKMAFIDEWRLHMNQP